MKKAVASRRTDGGNPVAQASTIDWTGVQPDQSPIAPLDDQTFALRLRLLSERAESVTILRKAFTDRSSDGEQLP